MKYLHKFSTFINESIKTDHSRREEEPLTPAQEAVVDRLVTELNSKKSASYDDVRQYSDGTILAGYEAPLHDWMDLTAYGEDIRMWINETAQFRPIFLPVEGVSQDELKRMVDLGLVEDLDKYINLDGEYITGFNISIEIDYSSKDVPFEHTEGGSASEYYTADYLDLTSSAPQDYETVAENLLDAIENWFNLTALREQDLQEMLDKQFPEEEEDEEDEEDYCDACDRVESECICGEENEEDEEDDNN